MSSENYNSRCGTPSGEDGSADLNYVLEAASSIGQIMISPKIIVNKSTVPVGTGDRVRNVISQELKKMFHLSLMWFQIQSF